MKSGMKIGQIKDRLSGCKNDKLSAKLFKKIIFGSGVSKFNSSFDIKRNSLFG